MTKLHLFIIAILVSLVSTTASANKIYTKSDCIAAVTIEIAGEEYSTQERSLASDMIIDYLARYQQPLSSTIVKPYNYYFFGFPEGCDQKTEILNKAIKYYKDSREKPLKYIYVLNEVIEASQDTIDDNYDFITITDADLKRYQPEECIASIEVLEETEGVFEKSEEFFDKISDYLYHNVRLYSVRKHSDLKNYYLFRYPKGCQKKSVFLLEAIENYRLLTDNPISEFEILTTGIQAGNDTISANFRFFNQ